MEWKFRIPSGNISSEFSEDELGQDVVVVSFFGKSNFDDDGPIVDDYPTDFAEIPQEKDHYDSYIDGYYSKTEKVIYLFLVGAYNPRTLVRLLSSSAQEYKEKGFLHCYNKCKSSYGRALLYLFSLSHIIVICHPNSVPDLNVVQLLKILSSLRPSYQSLVSNVLSKLENLEDSDKQKATFSDNLKEVLNHGRMCSPRLLFLFESPPDIALEEEEKRATRTLRLQHSLEDQLYMTLRKCRLVKNLCNRALFSIAPNDEFVHVQHTANSETPAERCFRTLMEKLEINEDEERNSDETLGAHLFWNTSQPIDPEIDKIWRRKPLDSVTPEIPQDFVNVPQTEVPVNDLKCGENVNDASNPDWSLSALSSEFSSLSMYPEFIPRSYDQAVIENCSYDELSQPRNLYDLYSECSPWTATVQEGSYYDPCVIPNVPLEDYYIPTPYTTELNPELWQYSVIPEDPHYVDEGIGCTLTDVQEGPLQFGKKASSCTSMVSSSASSTSSSFWALSDDENGSQSKNAKSGKRFRAFLQKHISKAHNEGFNDNMGKFSNMKPFFLKPKIKEWLRMTETISHELKLGVIDVEFSSQFQFGTELQFSSARCKKIIPLALAHYQESLPSHYNRSVHERHLKKAIDIFTHHARGPEQEKFISELKVQCENIWKTRHTCDALSLSKNSCTKPAQQCANSNLDKEVEHWSGIQCVSTCNCGMKQGSRPDPFTLKAANFSFYVDIGKECGCIGLDHVKFPVFQPSIHDFKAANVQAFGFEKAKEENLSCSVNTLANLYQELNTNSVQNTLSVGNIGKLWSPTHSDSPVNEEGTPATSQLSDQSGNLVLDYFDPNNQEKHLVRQASTTEYLPGMIHIDSPRGLLPQFPSWSLLCRGPSSLYSHNLGLHDQPGFILGSSYLLPWDVVIRENNEISNAAVTELKKAQNTTYSSRAGYKKYQRQQKDFISVKIFIGVEYECLRGHRFMSSAPGKILQVSPNGIVKENANKITKGNMPLYLTCPCGKSMAQLMRIHVVTPKAPVYVTIDPKVRPGPMPSPTFVTGNQKPIALTQSTYWVLRLPFVYVSERSVYSIPHRVKKMKHGELIGPTYGITQITE